MNQAADKKVILVIMDGWGVAPAAADNAVALAATPCFDRLLVDFPHTTIGASGKDVGLPNGQMGNSEVGHLNIGAGRRVLQELSRISEAIESGEFFHNPELLGAFAHAKDSHQAVHLVGLISDGGVHSHSLHLQALLEMARQAQVTEVFVHAILDGRDTPPQSAKAYLQQIQQRLDENLPGSFATVSGRYYAMDRDSRWDRLEKAYRAIVDGDGPVFTSVLAALDNAYATGETDEFVIPRVIAGYSGIKDRDSVIFFNFRPDRVRQLPRAMLVESFDHIPNRRLRQDLYCVTFTNYADDIPAHVAFKAQILNQGLGEVLAEAGLTQLRLAETEKYAHVTFFFNGGRELVYPGEDRIMIPSPHVATYDLQPEMSAAAVATAAEQAMASGKYNLIVVNFANADMVGHTGIMTAAKQAVETVDACLSRLVVSATDNGYAMLITADHGNAEQMFDYTTGQAHSAHTCNQVPFILVNSSRGELRTGGILADIAPTVLQLLGIEQPTLMSGQSLIKE
jgi:2,3-bisphosphoglycerate-independent phosphoglycerate mutase